VANTTITQTGTITITRDELRFCALCGRTVVHYFVKERRHYYCWRFFNDNPSWLAAINAYDLSKPTVRP